MLKAEKKTKSEAGQTERDNSTAGGEKRHGTLTQTQKVKETGIEHSSRSGKTREDSRQRENNTDKQTKKKKGPGGRAEPTTQLS